jgi:hypothetical protein
MGASPVDACPHLDRIDQLLAHLADALRRAAEDREMDAATPSHAPAPGTPARGNLGALAAAVRASNERTR